MAILGLLAEIYAMPNLKMNLKFEIEVILAILCSRGSLEFERIFLIEISLVSGPV